MSSGTVEGEVKRDAAELEMERAEKAFDFLFEGTVKAFPHSASTQVLRTFAFEWFVLGRQSNWHEVINELDVMRETVVASLKSGRGY